jgi:hypothetical protein
MCKDSGHFLFHPNKPLPIPKSLLIVFFAFCVFSGSFLHGDQVIPLTAPGYKIELGQDGFHKIVIDGFYSYGLPGYPDVPCKVYRIAVPPQTDLRSIKVGFDETGISSLGSFEIRELPPMAAWRDGQLIVEPKANVYSSNAFYPEKTIEVLGTSQMRKWRMVNIQYNPFRYNPVTKELKLVSRVTLSVQYTSPGKSIVSDDELADGVMEERAQRKIFNYSESKDWYVPSLPPAKPSVIYNYVIITTSQIQTASTKLADFVNYLKGKGYSPLIVTEANFGGLTGQAPNGTAEKIRQWLINNYLTYSIEHVLLVGNPDPSASNIPMKMCWPRHGSGSDEESPTDYFYADLTGNWDLDADGYFGEYSGDKGTGGVDFDNEVYVGRIPVYTQGIGSLDSVLTKVMSYGNSTNTVWRKNALLPMSYSDASTDGAYLGEAMKTDYLTPAGISSWTMYMKGGLCAAANSSFACSQELLDGATKLRWMDYPYGLVLWWGHGSATSAMLGYSACGWGTILSSTDTTSLNDTYPSFVYQNSCTNGYPESSSNLGTALLYKGAIATVSASRVSWYAVTSWSTSLKYYCDNASIGYFYGKELVSNSKKAAVALFDVKSDMGIHAYSNWGGASWMNLFDFNLYGNPTTALLEQSRATKGYYVLDGYGGVHAGGSVAALSPATPYFGWDIAKDLELTPAGTGYYVLDGYGGIHAGGTASAMSPVTPYFGWNIAKDLELILTGDGYYVLDGYGGVHAGGKAPALSPATPYFGWNFARDLELTIADDGYYVLDGYGGVHKGGAAPVLTSATPYFGFDIAKDMELTSAGSGYYVLDGYGGVHRGGGASAITPATPYFGWDIAKSLALTPAGDGYYVLDGFGGVHVGGAASILTPKTPYFGWNIARRIKLVFTS